MSRTAFETPASDFVDRVHRSFTDQAFMGFLGARLGAVEPGYVEISLPHRPELGQQHGFFHGGVVATLADNAAGFAAFSLMDDTEQPLSVEFKINLINGARGERLEARAEVIKNGRTLKICRADVYASAGDGETHCATALVSVIALDNWRD